MGYIIIGDTEKYKDCLVVVCCGKENAEKTLARMQTAPTNEDRRRMKGHTNFRIQETKPEEEWWNDPFLAN